MHKGSENKKTGADNFIRYRSGELKGRERNAFEKELEKDPFAAEAAEGFSELSHEAIAGDLSELDRKLARRTGRKSYPVLRIAATVALLFSSASVIYLLLQQKPSVAELAIAEKSIKTEKELTSPYDSTVRPPVIKHEPAAGITSDRKESAEAKPLINTVTDAMLEVSAPPAAPSEQIKEELNALSTDSKKELAPVRSKAAAVRPQSDLIRGRIISAEDGTGIPGVSVTALGTTAGTLTDEDGNFSLQLPDSSGRILVASYIGMKTSEFRAGPDDTPVVALNPELVGLSEVVVTGYGVSKYDGDEDAEVAKPYLSPRPAEGRREFENYIRNNIRIPDTTSLRKAVVVLNFLVRTDGTIDSLEVVRSPGRKYSDEAIRLIRQGPAWLPAEDEGKPVDDRVKVRIVFR